MLLNIATLLINTLTGILGGVFLLRFWTQAVGARPPLSLAQFISQLSDWLVRPLRRLIPSLASYDWVCLFAAYLVSFFSHTFEGFLLTDFPIQYTAFFALLGIVQWIIYGATALLMLEAIFSWVNPQAPLAPFVQTLNQPLLRTLRSFIPIFGNIDFSPFAALLIIQIIQHVLNALKSMLT